MQNTHTTKTECLILRRVAEIGQKSVSEAINRDCSVVSRIFSNKNGLHLNELELFLSALNLKIIECDGDTVTISADEFKAMQLLAIKGLNK